MKHTTKPASKINARKGTAEAAKKNETPSHAFETYDHSEKKPEETTETVTNVAGTGAASGSSSSAPAGGKPPKQTYQWKMRQLGPAHKRSVLANRAAQRVAKIVESFASYSLTATVDGKSVDLFATARTQLASAVDLLKAGAESLAAVPKDWRPSGRVAGVSVPKKPLAVGDAVAIREKARAEFKGILPDAEMTELKVTLVGEKKVGCTTKSGTTIVVARALLVPFVPTAAAAE